MNDTKRNYESECCDTMGNDPCAKETNERQIEEQMNITSELLDRLDKYTSVLEWRLKDVLRDEQEWGCENMEQVALVPLAETMRRNNQKLGNRINELENIISRLEI